MRKITTQQAYEHLQRQMRDDPDYAWGWHCNIACPIMDSGVDHELANKAAARVMEHLFKAKVDHYTPRVKP